MTTTQDTSNRHLYSVNADAADTGTGVAIMAFIVAAAARREHLRHAIKSIQYDTEQGIGVLVHDAGHRQHLANALGFNREIQEQMTDVGIGFRRTGEIEGIRVIIWNLEP